MTKRNATFFIGAAEYMPFCVLNKKWVIKYKTMNFFNPQLILHVTAE